jgi:hypothetical protein
VSFIIEPGQYQAFISDKLKQESSFAEAHFQGFDAGHVRQVMLKVKLSIRSSAVVVIAIALYADFGLVSLIFMEENVIRNCFYRDQLVVGIDKKSFSRDYR